MPTYTDYRCESYAAPAAITSIDGTTDVDDVNEELDLTAHGLRDGEMVLYEDGADATPITGLTDGDLYWAHVIDANTISLHNSRADALSDTSRVGLTDTASSTTNSLTPYRIPARISAAGSYTFDNCFFDLSGVYEIHCTHTTGTVTITLTNNSTVPRVLNTGGATVEIVNNKTVSVSVDDNVGVDLEDARVRLVASTGGDLTPNQSVSITRSGSTATATQTAHGMATGDEVMIVGADQIEYNGYKTITVTGANTYTFTVSGTPDTPATGTITGQAVILRGLTNASGLVQTTTFNYTNDQPIEGVARKSSRSPQNTKLFYEFARMKTLEAYQGIGPTLTCTRALATATRVNSNRQIETVAADTPRFDHDPVTGESLGLLVERVRTNLCLRSEEFNTTWVASRVTVTANQETAPDGFLTADELTENNENDEHYIRQAITVATATDHVMSCFAKAGERTWLMMGENIFSSNRRVSFDLANGVVGTEGAGVSDAGMEEFPNGWYRCWIAWNTTSTTANFDIQPTTGDDVLTYLGDGSSSLYVWGADLEAGVYPTSYIPTTSASVQRNRDLITTTTLDWFNTTTGSWYVKCRLNDDEAQTKVVFYIENGWNDRIFSEFNSTQQVRFRSVHSTDTDGISDGSVSKSINTDVDIAGAYADDDFIAYVDGASSGLDSTAAFPLGATMATFRIGNAVDTGFQPNGHIKELRYYDERLSNTVLEDASNGDPPRGRRFKSFPLAGTITSSGFSTSVRLILDE